MGGGGLYARGGVFTGHYSTCMHHCMAYCYNTMYMYLLSFYTAPFSTLIWPLQCSYCLNEAQYNCCWNANYCNETCQQNHWPEHMKNCTQVQQQQQPQQPPSARTPGPTEIPTAPGGGGGGGGTPVATAAPLQFHPSMALMSNASAATAAGGGGGGPPPVFTSGQQQQEAAAAHQQNLLYMARSAAAAAAAAGGVRTVAQGQGGQPGQGQQGMPHQLVSQIPAGSLAVSEIPYSWKIWWGIKFGGLADCLSNRQIKIYQTFLLAYIHMAILYRTTKFKSANTFEMAIWDTTAKFNSHQYFQLYGIQYMYMIHTHCSLYQWYFVYIIVAHVCMLLVCSSYQVLVWAYSGSRCILRSSRVCESVWYVIHACSLNL